MTFLNQSPGAIAARVAIGAVLIFLAFAAPGCGDKESKEALYGVAKALHRVANATARADGVTHRFFLDGLISAKQAEAIALALADINSASAEFQRKARTYSTFDTKAQADLLKLADDARDYVNGRIADGTLQIKDRRAQAEWRTIINAAYDAFSAIVLLIRSAKPQPAPSPTSSIIPPCIETGNKPPCFLPATPGRNAAIYVSDEWRALPGRITSVRPAQ